MQTTCILMSHFWKLTEKGDRALKPFFPFYPTGSSNCQGSYYLHKSNQAKFSVSIFFVKTFFVFINWNEWQECFCCRWPKCHICDALRLIFIVRLSLLCVCSGAWEHWVRVWAARTYTNFFRLIGRLLLWGRSWPSSGNSPVIFTLPW